MSHFSSGVQTDDGQERLCTCIHTLVKVFSCIVGRSIFYFHIMSSYNDDFFHSLVRFKTLPPRYPLREALVDHVVADDTLVRV